MPKFKPELRKEWERRVARFRSSGQTQVAWCKENNLSLRQLGYWIKQIEKTNSVLEKETKWVPVFLDDNSQGLSETLVIRIGDASIEVKPGFNSSFLVDVVRTLKSLC